MSNTVVVPKTLVFLSNYYYERFLEGMTFESAILKLISDESIFLYNEDLNEDDLKTQTGFIESREDIQKNYKALSFAIYKFFDITKTGYEPIDTYILEFSNMKDEDILELNNEDNYALKMTNTDKIW